MLPGLSAYVDEDTKDNSQKVVKTSSLKKVSARGNQNQQEGVVTYTLPINLSILQTPAEEQRQVTGGEGTTIHESNVGGKRSISNILPPPKNSTKVVKITKQQTITLLPSPSSTATFSEGDVEDETRQSSLEVVQTCTVHNNSNDQTYVYTNEEEANYMQQLKSANEEVEKSIRRSKRRGEKVQVVQVNQKVLLDNNWRDSYDPNSYYAPSKTVHKLHRQKNQLTSLVSDSVARQHEFETKKDQMRRTKAEVRAKYGW